MVKYQESGRFGRFAVIGVLALGLSLSGCQKTREAFGLNKSAPDEFAVVTRAPLSMPPDYGLRPPTPGVQRPQERDIKDEARRILVTSGTGGASTRTGAAPSVGESALLNRAGAANTDSSIRQTVSRENKLLAAGDSGFVDRLIFWRKPDPKHSEIDASREARRLNENAAMGDPVTKGATPVIQRKKRGILGGIF
ncbi:MAG: DUF3035 domain-containing protein [Pseudomonadota bacterium]|nr:DUF3035 domain-containing protein [Pseudomonadota bacterium]